MASSSFGSKRPRAEHLVRGRRGLKGEVADLRRDVDEAFETVEVRAVFQGAFTNAARPDPSTLTAGDWIFNTTSNAPEWSNGTIYFDATGTPT